MNTIRVTTVVQSDGQFGSEGRFSDIKRSAIDDTMTFNNFKAGLYLTKKPQHIEGRTTLPQSCHNNALHNA